MKRCGLLIGLFLFGLSFLLRFSTWIYPGLGWGKLTIYDVALYTEYGTRMVHAFLKLDLKTLASINIGVPPLGTFVTGVFAMVFKNVIGDYYRAGLLAPIVTSSITASLIYFSLRKLSQKTALFASLIFAFDPYLIQFSSVYLDTIGTLFIMCAFYFFIQPTEASMRKSLFTGLFIMLSILTKLTFAVFAFFLIIILALRKEYKQALIILAFVSFSILLIPWIWFQETFQRAVIHHTSLNSLLPPIFFGPLMINVPESYPWYLLTYIGLGQIHWNTLPSISHMFLLIALIYRLSKRSFSIDPKLLIFSSLSVLTIVFIPRNYWRDLTEAFASNEKLLARIFLPYYFYLPNSVAGLVASSLILGKQSKEELFGGGSSSLLLLPIIMYAFTAPFAFIMNLMSPCWDFIFTLILNFSQKNVFFESYGFIALIITCIMALTVVILTIISLRIIAKKI